MVSSSVIPPVPNHRRNQAKPAYVIVKCLNGTIWIRVEQDRDHWAGVGSCEYGNEPSVL